jgi:gelsolin
MEKQKKYDWQDTNMALFGSDVEINIKKASAEGEAQWKDVGEKAELRVWRIEQFKVVAWPSSKYGQFHEGDTYVLLNTYQPDPVENPKKLAWDVHFWIGKFSTQDEYGTAAYKTCELDHLLDDAAIQHREVMGAESVLFQSYFPSGIRLLKGGTETGFTHVEEEVVPVRLFHVKGGKNNVTLKETKLRRDKMNSGDVFVLDTGDAIWQWNGADSNMHEKRQAQAFCAAVRADRSGKPTVTTMDEGGGDGEEEQPEFWKHLPGDRKLMGITVGQIKVKSADDGGDDGEQKGFQLSLFRLHEGMGIAGGSLSFGDVDLAAGATQVPANKLDPKDVFLLDTGLHLYIWIGSEASLKEKASGFTYAQK